MTAHCRRLRCRIRGGKVMGASIVTLIARKHRVSDQHDAAVHARAAAADQITPLHQRIANA